MQHSLTHQPTIDMLTAAVNDCLGVRAVFSEGSFVRYTTGQYFRVHGDVADMDESERRTRQFTLVYCMRAPARGGATSFPRKRMQFTLSPNEALLWSNLLPSGAEDEAMDHEALPVLDGEKMIINAWFRLAA